MAASLPSRLASAGSAYGRVGAGGLGWSWSNVTVRDQFDSLCELVAADELLVPDNSDACRAAVRAFRPRRVLPAVVAASLLTAAGTSVAVQVVSALAGRPVLGLRALAPAARLVSTARWHDPAVLAVGGGVALTGLVFVLAAVLPGRTRTMALAGDDPEFMIGVRRSSLREVLRSAALEVPGIIEARVRVRGRWWPRAVVNVVTGFRNPGTLEDMVAGAVRSRLDGLGPVRRVRVTVRLTWRRD